MTTSSDVVIIGAGVQGASAAFYLKVLDPSLQVSVVEVNPSRSRQSATSRSVAMTMLQTGNSQR